MCALCFGVSFQYFSHINSWNRPKRIVKANFPGWEKDFLPKINQGIIKSLSKITNHSRKYSSSLNESTDTFVKQKLRVMTFRSSLPTINLLIGKILNWMLDKNLDFLQQRRFFYKQKNLPVSQDDNKGSWGSLKVIDFRVQIFRGYYTFKFHFYLNKSAFSSCRYVWICVKRRDLLKMSHQNLHWKKPGRRVKHS